METRTAVLLSIGILASTATAYSFAKKKPYIAATIMGSFGAFGLIYTLITVKEVSLVRRELESGH